jgi:hypothetical protein
METQNLPPQRLHFIWKAITAVNLILGLHIWFFSLTDYSFKGNDGGVNILIAAIGGFFSWLYLRRKYFTHKRLYLFVYKFSTFAALPLVPFWLLTLVGGSFHIVRQIDLRNNKTVINNNFVCTDNSYCAVEIRLRYDFLHFIERDVYSKSSNVPADVSWVNNEIIAINLSGDRIEIKPGWIKFEWPGWNMFFIALYFIYLLVRKVFIKTKQVSI